MNSLFQFELHTILDQHELVALVTWHTTVMVGEQAQWPQFGKHGGC